MAQSSEYPDLAFVPPAAYGAGRDGKAVRYLVVHYTAGAERSTSAEDGAAFDQRRTDGTSTHYFADSDSVVQCVLTTNRANACFHKGNRLGIQYELCGTAQTPAQWMDAASRATIRNAARQMARDAAKYDIPIRRLSVAETRAAWYSFPAGPLGIVGHVDVTQAYPEDGGNHTDPGPGFPWEVLLSDIRGFMAEGDDMSFNDRQKADAAFNGRDEATLDTDTTDDGAGALATFPVPITGMVKSAQATADRALLLAREASERPNPPAFDYERLADVLLARWLADRTPPA